MLNRAILSPAWPTSRLSDWRRGLSARQAAMVRRYILGVIVLSALGCLYLWQLNVITDLRNETWRLLEQAQEVEGVNAALMNQLAQWQSPAYVEQRAREAGWLLADEPVYVQLPAAPQARGNAGNNPANGNVTWLASVPAARSIR